MTRNEAIHFLKQLEILILGQNSWLTRTKNAVTESFDMAFEALKQPERKKGKWTGEERQRLIDETDDGCVYMTDTWWYCSECGNPKGYVGHKPEDKYCNECGAKMEDEDAIS